MLDVTLLQLSVRPILDSVFTTSLSNLGFVRSNLFFTLSNLGIVRSNLSFALSNLGIVRSNLSFALSNLGIVCSNLLLTLSNLGFVRSNLSFMLSNLGFVCAYPLRMQCKAVFADAVQTRFGKASCGVLISRVSLGFHF
jgi:hypothetical protein